VKTAFCTIATRSHIRFARTVGHGVRGLHPECDFFILVPEFPSQQSSQDLDLPTFGVADLGLPNLDDMLIYYDKFSFCNNIKPFLLGLLLDRGYDKVVYLDSDLFVVGRFDDLLEELDRSSFVLTPHWINPVLSGSSDVSPEQIVELGVYNGGLLALRNDAAGRQVAEWLKRNLAATRLPFADQKFLSLAAQLYDTSFKSLTHPGYNIAYWNFHEREVSISEGRYSVSGVPVVFFHLSGFRPETPTLLSVHGSRSTAGSPIKAQIIADYLNTLAPADVADSNLWPERVGTRKLTPRMRAYYLQHRSIAGFRRSEILRYWTHIRTVARQLWLR
jgi:hypothetical protein